MTAKDGGAALPQINIRAPEAARPVLIRLAQIIRVADQGGMFWLWAVVDTEAPDEERNFVAVKCGANVPRRSGLIYIGFCAIFVQQELGLYIFEDTTHDQD